MKLNGFEAGIDEDNRVFIILSVRRHDDKKTVKVRFKYDPGADISTISLDDLALLGYSLDDVKQNSYKYGEATTADGAKYEMSAMNLHLNSIMGQVIPRGFKFPFACLTKKHVPIPKLGCSGCRLTGDIYGGFRSSLLGNDILSGFNVSSDRENAKMLFTRLSDLSARNLKYPHCELLELGMQATVVY